MPPYVNRVKEFVFLFFGSVPKSLLSSNGSLCGKISLTKASLILPSLAHGVEFIRTYNIQLVHSMVSTIMIIIMELHRVVTVVYYVQSTFVRLKIIKTPFMTSQDVLTDVKSAAIFFKLSANRFGLGLSKELLSITIAQGAGKL